MTELRTVETPLLSPIDIVVESNHRIANHLGTALAIIQRQITAMQTGPALVPREEIVRALKEMVGKILALSSLHGSFAAHPVQGALDLNDVLMNILSELKRSGLFGDRLRIASLLGPDCQVQASQATLLALALSEIVTNSLKYAHPTGLPVVITIASAATPDGGVILEIADDGVGFPEGFDEVRDAGVGLKMVRSLVEQSDGRLAISSDGLGVTFSIQLPPK